MERPSPDIAVRVEAVARPALQQLGALAVTGEPPEAEAAVAAEEPL
tara:strand:- start:975 stop:1112 length:138 start_codon:yes stop_codon:yes gene_type:complete